MEIQDIVNPETINAVADYLVKKAYSTAKTEQIDKIYNGILREMPIHASDHPRRRNRNGERILDHNLLYLCRDKSVCQEFYKACDKAAKSAGAKPADMERDHCPALVAQHDLIKAENHLLNLTGKPFGFESCDFYGSKRDEWLNLVCSACV